MILIWLVGTLAVVAICLIMVNLYTTQREEFREGHNHATSPGVLLSNISGLDPPASDRSGPRSKKEILAEADNLKLGNDVEVVASSARSLAVLNQLKSKYRCLLVVLREDVNSEQDESLRHIKAGAVDRLETNLKVIRDIVPTDGDTSSTVNKERIEMCVVRDPESSGSVMSGLFGSSDHGEGEYHEPDGVVTYVFLHELAHVAEVERDHTESFWRTFEWILRIASRHGLYTSEDYREGVEYCGITVR